MAVAAAGLQSKLRSLSVYGDSVTQTALSYIHTTRYFFFSISAANHAGGIFGLIVDGEGEMVDGKAGTPDVGCRYGKSMVRVKARPFAPGSYSFRLMCVPHAMELPDIGGRNLE